MYILLVLLRGYITVHGSENVKFAILNIRILPLSLQGENSENLEKCSPLELRKDCTAANSEALLGILSDTEYCYSMR